MKKDRINQLIVFLGTALLISCQSSPKNDNDIRAGSDHTVAAFDSSKRENAAKEIQRARIKTQDLQILDTIIKDQVTAIAVAEPILFSTYGKSTIEAQRPYDIYHIDNYWYIGGNLASGSDGGDFQIILSALDGKVLDITHYK